MVLIKLKSAEGETFTVEESIANMIGVGRAFLGERKYSQGEIFPLNDVKSVVLQKIIEWAKYHHQNPDAPVDEDGITAFDKEFMKMDQSTWFSVILAAHHLEIKEIMTLAVKYFGQITAGKTMEELCAIFNIQVPSDQ